MSGADKPVVEYELTSIEAYRFAAVESEYEYAAKQFEGARRRMEESARFILDRVGAKDIDVSACHFDKRNGGIFLKVGGAS